MVAGLVILFHYDLPVKHPSPLPQHVEVELRKHWGWKKNQQKLLKLLRCLMNVYRATCETNAITSIASIVHSENNPDL